MNKWILALFLGAAAIGLAWAQTVPSPGPPNGIACAYNASPPTLTTGTAGWIQCDSAGKLITSGGGGGGGAVTIADGADVAQGTTTDAACATDNGTCTEIALLKRENQRLTTINTTLGSPFQAGGALAANQSVNLTQILGAAPSLTNPLWVFPATGATFPVSLAVNTPTLAASENHIGEVGGNIIPIMNAMTTSNNSITTGEAMGGLQTLTNAVRVSGSLGASGTSGIIQSVMVTFKDAITTPWDVYVFNANPTGSTCTDNTTFALADADRDKVIGVAHITDMVASNTAVIGQAMNQAIPFGVASATSIFACVVSRGTAAITGTANASLIIRVLRN